MNEETKPTTAPKAAVKPATPKPEIKPMKIVVDPSLPAQGMQSSDWDKFEKDAKPEEPKLTLGDFDNWLKLAPKEWLPTMMVRIANKCLAEKVFASPGAMAEAIVGASKGK